MELADVEAVAAADHYLAVVVTTRSDATPQASVVNAGLLAHPVSGERVAAFVTYGPAKLANLRRRPYATVVWRSGWRWAALEGPAQLVGPDDPLAGVAPASVPGLIRDVFGAAGGTHEDWDEFDRVMRDERRVVVLVAPQRLYSNRR